jgi:hypothetical protein
MTRTAALGCVLAVAAAGCSGRKATPRLQASASWDDTYAMPGCARRLLRLEVATVAYAEVRAGGERARADEDGEAVLELRQAAAGRGDRVTVAIDGASLDVPLPPVGAPRPVAVGLPDEEPAAGAIVWTGAGTGALATSGMTIVHGTIEGQDLVFRLRGCDLRGGRVEDGAVIGRGPDDVEVRIAIARRLAAATSLRPLAGPIAIALENADGARGQVTLTGTLDVVAALGAMQAAAAGVKVAGAPAWQPGGAILVAGPGLTDLARADRLLRGRPIGEAAAVLSLAITQAASEKRCGGYRDAAYATGLSRSAPTTKAQVQASLVARATGEVLAERAFVHEADCPSSIRMVHGMPETVAAGPGWDDLLGWLEEVGGAPAGP